MFKNHKILVACFMLAALFAGTAHAITTMELDPGTPGEAAQNFDFGQQSLDVDGLLRVTFTDNKTLEWTAGSHLWLSPGQPLDLDYFGAFLDSNLDPIADFIGKTTGVGGDLSPPIVAADLEDDGVFSGLLFSFGTNTSSVNIDWEWDSADTPRVGQGVVPVPAAVWLFGSGLLGLIGMARRKKA